jgi:hypothetical protein
VTAGQPALERCVGDVERFAREHWARAPLYRPRADAGAFADLFSLADVDHLIASASLRTPAFRLVKDGRPLPAETYTKSGKVGSRPLADLADPGRIFALFDGGATIVLQSLHRFWPPLTRFCRDLELALTHPVQVNVYVTPPASRGLGVHHDTHDVFVLQVSGSKQWDVYDVGDERGGGERRIVAGLQPGDAMYIPTTFPHQARTAASTSVHLTVGILSTTWRDVLRPLVDEALADAAFARPLPPGFAERPQDLAPAVADQLRELASRIEKHDPGAVADGAALRFWSTRPPILTGQLQQLLALGDLDDRTMLRRRAGAVCRLRRDGERLAVHLGDRELRMPLRLEPVLRAILAREAFAVGDLADHLDGHGRLVLARRLVREGLLEAVLGGDRPASEVRP